jgi:uncharacterized damage-inducible protein DinB
MKFTVSHALEILERTPTVLDALLMGLSEQWTTQNEGPDTWSVYDIVGHLIHGEKTDWIPRMEIILSDVENKTFESFDRFAQFEASKGKTLSDLLMEFKQLRQRNVQMLQSKGLTEEDYSKTGVHPAFGAVSLAQLLSTWAVHDLNHLAQIARVMATQYKQEVGPWVAYLRILKS